MELPPIGIAHETGSSEEEAIERFLSSHPETKREQVVEVEVQSREFGMYVIRYARANVKGLDPFGYVRTHDNCAECSGSLQKPRRGAFPIYCSNRCTQRAYRRRRREVEAVRA